MVVGGETLQIDKWSRLALERLAHDGLPASSQNYAVYYHYVVGDIPKLNAAYNAIVAKGKISQQQCSDLFDAYIAMDSNVSFFKDANGVIETELQKLMEIVSISMKETNQFGENLSDFSGKLAPVASIEVLREAVEKIAEETHMIAVQNQKLQHELKSTTQQLSEMRDDFDRVHREAQIDPLTEIGNRKFFNREIVHKITEAQEQDEPMSLLMVDIDHFKNFNDMHGHLIGDQVLRLVARTLVENLKGRDVIARYGGEEFVILLPRTYLKDAEHVANQLRAALASKRITKRGSKETLGVVTISIGAAQYLAGEDGDTLVSRADVALYKAKQSGRNKVVCAEG